MKYEDSYQPGERVLFHEDGVIDRVEVLENNSDDEFVAYRFKVVGVVKNPVFNFLKPSEEGEEFDCCKKRGNYFTGALWSLEEEVLDAAPGLVNDN